MIPFTALLATGTAAPQGDVSVIAAGLSLEGAAFCDILAALPSLPVTAEADLAGDPSAELIATAVPVSTVDPQAAGQILPATGKILPEVLPGSSDPLIVESAASQEPQQAKTPKPVLHRTTAVLRVMPEPEDTNSAAESAQQMVVEETSQLVVNPVINPLSFQPIIILPGQSPLVARSPDDASPASAMLPPVPPPAQAAANPSAQATLAIAPPAVATASAASPAPQNKPFAVRLEIDPAPPPSTPPAIAPALPAAALVASAVAVEAPTQPSAVRRVATARAAVKNEPSEQLAIPVATAGLALSPATPPTSTPQPASNRPQDFAALVDRLVAAREAVQPQAVTLAVPHADFGRVQLHFRHEADGLAVLLSNADPDFGRSVQHAAAASPLEGYRPEPALAPLPQTAQRSTSNQADSGLASQHRGPAPRGDPRHHRNPAASSPSDNRPDRRSGIFA